jgi:hypothetical protein
VLVVGRDVFATHYVDGAWSFTALLRATPSNYLMYLNQSDVDLLDTWYGGLVRRVAERRLREEAVDVLNGLRRRLESGDPPARAASEEESCVRLQQRCSCPARWHSRSAPRNPFPRTNAPEDHGRVRTVPVLLLELSRP